MYAIKKVPRKSVEKKLTVVRAANERGRAFERSSKMKRGTTETRRCKRCNEPFLYYVSKVGGVRK